MIKIGIIREGKKPSDSRVALMPDQVIDLEKKYDDLSIVLQSSDVRAIKDDEYAALGIQVVNSVDDCDILLGVKEVPIEELIHGKTYFFFSHTFKEQPYNRALLQNILDKKIRLIDYETLVDAQAVRLIGFGRYAGIVGAHYALLMWGRKNNLYSIKPAHQCHDYAKMVDQYQGLDYGSVSIFVTGNGRVSRGSAELLKNAGIRQVSLEEYLGKKFHEAIFVQCDMDELYFPRNSSEFDFQHFFTNPSHYNCVFNNYFNATDILINGMYWNPKAERLFSKQDVMSPEFNIKVISDISCDIDGSVPITYRATTIDDPYYGVDKKSGNETGAFAPDSIDLMTVDNLPNELPRDASEMFGEVMSQKIIPLLIKNPDHPVLRNATIAQDGKLMPDFQYLTDYVNGK